MSKLKLFIIPIVAACLLLSLSGYAPAYKGEKIEKDQLYERTSKFFSVDKTTIEGLEKTLQEKKLCQNKCYKDTINIIIVSRFRTEQLISEGKITRDRYKEAMGESIKYFLSKKAEGTGCGIGCMGAEVSLGSKNLQSIAKALLGSYFVDKKAIENLQKEGLSVGDAIKIYVLARNRTEKLISTGEYTKGQDEKAMEDNIKYFHDKKLKEDKGWNALTEEVDMKPRDLNTLVAILVEYRS